MNRRDLLKYGAAAFTLGALGPLLRTRKATAAAPSSPRRLILVFAQGGWDTTYSIDPKTQSDEIDIPDGGTGCQVKTYGSGGLDAFLTSGPAGTSVDTFFTAYAANTAIVRGISVASVAHAECAKRMCTGTRDSTSPDMGAIVAHDLADSLPLPYLILGDTAFSGPYAASAGRVGPTNQIIALLDPKQAYQTGSSKPFATTSAEDDVLQAYSMASATATRTDRAANGYNAARVDDLTFSLQHARLLQGKAASFGHRGATLKLADQVTLGVTALQQGIAQSVMLNTELKWDTHSQNTDQEASHQALFDGLKQLLDALATTPGQQSGTYMIDDTCVVVFSEMGRTPKLNANSQPGKDHWPVTSAMVMGAGVKGGVVLGATTDGLDGTNGMQAELLDFTTGAVSATGQSLMFQNFAAGVLQLCGVDPATHFSGTPVFDAFIA